MNKLEIIDDTIDFYSKNKRAFNVDIEGCVYRTDEGYRCAHSRCIKDEFIDDIVEKFNDSYNADDVISYFGDFIHKEEYQGHSDTFWNDIQNLHDRLVYWEQTDTGNKLTYLGKNFVEDLKNKYKNEIGIY